MGVDAEPITGLMKKGNCGCGCCRVSILPTTAAVTGESLTRLGSEQMSNSFLGGQGEGKVAIGHVAKRLQRPEPRFLHFHLYSFI